MKSLFSQAAPAAKYDHDLAFDLFGEDGKVTIGCFDPEAENCIAIYGDGSWEKVTNQIGVFTVKKDSFKIPYIKETGTPSFVMRLPKFPYGMLLGIAKFFKEVMANIKDSESMVQIYWDLVRNEYFIHVPKQTVSKAHINFERDPALQSDTNKLLVCDIHSHNSMSAFWSGTDNSDEKGIKLFGVLGELNKNQWASKWRAGCNGQYINLELSDFWDLSQEDLIEIPQSEHANITEHVYAPNVQTVGFDKRSGQTISFSDWQKSKSQHLFGFNDDLDNPYANSRIDYGLLDYGGLDYHSSKKGRSSLNSKSGFKKPSKKAKKTNFEMIIGDFQDHLYDLSFLEGQDMSYDNFFASSLLESMFALLIDMSNELGDNEFKTAFLQLVFQTIISEYDKSDIDEAIQTVLNSTENERFT